MHSLTSRLVSIGSSPWACGKGAGAVGGMRWVGGCTRASKLKLKSMSDSALCGKGAGEMGGMSWVDGCTGVSKLQLKSMPGSALSWVIGAWQLALGTEVGLLTVAGREELDNWCKDEVETWEGAVEALGRENHCQSAAGMAVSASHGICVTKSSNKPLRSPPSTIWNNTHQICFSTSNRSCGFPLCSFLHRKLVSHVQNAVFITPTRISVFLFTCFFEKEWGRSRYMGVNASPRCSGFWRPVNPGPFFVEFTYSWRNSMSSSSSWLSLDRMLQLRSEKFSPR